MLTKLVNRGCQWNTRRYLRTKSDAGELLRILFCGSDEFSVASLRALHEYSKTPDSIVSSIDVATKKDKPHGREMKALRIPPIKPVATELGLPVHQFDTFTGWTPPTYDQSKNPHINLVIAVSFGLLVPPRILNQAKFGGLNVHPSLLPHLRGAAPIHWSIINGDTHTGVSLQTLHPTRFDEGVVLAQTPKIEVPHDASVDELRGKLEILGGRLLVHGIRNKFYLAPRSVTLGQESSLAPKILPSMKKLQWQTDNLQNILRKNRGMPKLWANAAQPTTSEPPGSITWIDGDLEVDRWHPDFELVRILFGVELRAEQPGDIPPELRDDILYKIGQGIPFAILPTGAEPRTSNEPLFLTIKNEILVIPRLQVAGKQESPATAAAARAGLLREKLRIRGDSIYMFHKPLQNQD